MPAQHDMKHMHDIYRRMVESLPLCIYLAEFEPHGRWEFVSPQIETLTGYTAEEWTSQPDLWLASIHPDDRERVLEEEERHRSLPRGTQWTHEYRLISRDGAAVWVRDRALLVEVEDGRHLVEGVLTDIGEERLDDRRGSSARRLSDRVRGLRPSLGLGLRRDGVRKMRKHGRRARVDGQQDPRTCSGAARDGVAPDGDHEPPGAARDPRCRAERSLDKRRVRHCIK